MATLIFAAFDPLFWLHHSFVEKINEEWQDCRKKGNDYTWHRGIQDRPRNSALRCFDNDEINDKDEETFSVTTESLLRDRHKMCYKYDNAECKCHDSSLSETSPFKRGHQNAFETQFHGSHKYLVFVHSNVNFSGQLKFSICLTLINKDFSTSCIKKVHEDEITFFGDPYMTEENYQLYYYDITDVIENLQLKGRVHVF